MDPLLPNPRRERLPVPPAEVLGTPETPDTGREMPVETPETQKAPREAVAPAPVVAPMEEAPPVVDEQLERIEDVLSDGLQEVYAQLPPEARAPFKAKGEEVAHKIQEWIREAKLKVRAVLRAIREWLQMIPNVNRHYLEQESKIKADRIMDMARREQEDNPLA